jgi:hypothetical protein
VIYHLRRLFSRPERHYPVWWDACYATCKCGHSSAWDHDLRIHFTETGRIGK